MIAAEKLAQAKSLIDEFVSVQPAGMRLIEPGANLQSLAADCTAGETLVMAPGFVSGPLTLPKPVRIVGGKVIGPVVSAAAGVALRGVQIVGQNKGQTLVTTGDDMLIEDCILAGSAEGQHRGIRAESRNVTVRRTSIKGIWHSVDTQAISGDNGTKGLLVEDCQLEASGENVCFGGSDPTSEANIPQDITFRRCSFSKPLEWRPLPACTNKNLFELKNAKRVLVEDCTMAYSWVDGQTGFAIVLTVRNQNNTAPYSTIEDVTFRRVQVSHCAAGIQILGRDYTNPSGQMKRVTFEDVTVTDISPEWGSNQRVIQMGNGGEDLTFRRCMFSGSGINSAFTLAAGSPLFTRLVVDSCEFPEGSYGIKGDNVASLGTAALEAYAPGYLWTNNTVRINQPRPRVITWPAGTTII